MKNNWPVKKLGEVANIYGGGTPPTTHPEYFQGNINWFTPSELPVDNIGTVSESARKISDSAQQFTTISGAGTVILGSRASIGSVAILSTASGYNQGIKGIEPKKEEIDNWYLGYWLKANTNELLRKSFGTTFKEISTSAVRDLDISVPPLKTQKQIVEKLDEIRKAEELIDLQIEKTEELFKSTLFQDLTKLSGLEEKPLLEFCEKITDGVHNTPLLVKEGIPMLDSVDIQDMKINSNNPKKFISKKTDKELSKRCKPQEKDILLSSRGTIGKIAIVGKQDFNIMGNIILIRPNLRKLNSVYLANYLIVNREQIHRLSRATSQKGLYLTDVRNLIVKIPPIEDQKTIVEKLNSILEYKKFLQKQKILYTELFDSVLHKSMNGEME